jgi:TPR repeat protein
MKHARIALATSICTFTLAHAGLKEGEAAAKAHDYATALKAFTPLANKGDAAAQLDLGEMYQLGLGVTKDPKQAVAWYTKSAAQGNVLAELNLGSAYAAGAGVTRDDARALALWQKAADHGNPRAMHNVALMYSHGRGADTNGAKAIEYYDKAIAAGYSQSILNLAALYATGQAGVKKNEVAAYFILSLAPDNDLRSANVKATLASKMGEADIKRAQELLAGYQRGTPLPVF